MADGFHSISDSASNIVGIIGITLASKPKDTEHPYGHKKFETISSIIIGLMLLVLGFNVIKTSIVKIFVTSEMNITIESLVIILITLIINIKSRYSIDLFFQEEGKCFDVFEWCC